MRKRTPTRIHYILIVMALMTFLLSSCDGVSRISGSVRDVNGKPIAGASVELEDNGRSNGAMMTNAEGIYERMVVHAPSNDVKLTLRVSKEGYQAYQRTFTSGEAEKQKVFDVILEPATLPERAKPK